MGGLGVINSIKLYWHDYFMKSELVVQNLSIKMQESDHEKSRSNQKRSDKCG